MTEQELYTVKQVAKMLGVSEETIRRMIKEGEISITRVRFSIRIPKEEVSRLLGRDR